MYKCLSNRCHDGCCIIFTILMQKSENLKSPQGCQKICFQEVPSVISPITPRTSQGQFFRQPFGLSTVYTTASFRTIWSCLCYLWRNLSRIMWCIYCSLSLFLVVQMPAVHNDWFKISYVSFIRNQHLPYISTVLKFANILNFAKLSPSPR